MLGSIRMRWLCNCSKFSPSCGLTIVLIIIPHHLIDALFFVFHDKHPVENFLAKAQNAIDSINANVMEKSLASVCIESNAQYESLGFAPESPASLHSKRRKHYSPSTLPLRLPTMLASSGNFSAFPS